jgi:hypothetical protein
MLKVITDEERKEFMKGFPDKKTNDQVSGRTNDINGEDEEKFFVEKVIKMRVNRKGEEEFLVKWLGYPLSQATWEPFENLSGAEACEYHFFIHTIRPLLYIKIWLQFSLKMKRLWQ